MRNSIRAVALAAALMGCGLSFGQQGAPAGAPSGATGLCKDGTYWTGATKRGACHGHKGVKEWYGSASAGTGAAATNGAGAASGAGAAAGAGAESASRGSAETSAPTTPTRGASASAAAAPGAGPGQVWVNTQSKVYHCPGDRWYGKTKHGEYMSEADAKAHGDRPDHGKPCS